MAIFSKNVNFQQKWQFLAITSNFLAKMAIFSKNGNI